MSVDFTLCILNFEFVFLHFGEEQLQQEQAAQRQLVGRQREAGGDGDGIRSGGDESNDGLGDWLNNPL
jgi:hypothetical protein